MATTTDRSKSLEIFLTLEADTIECFICKGRRIEVGPPCGHYVCRVCMRNLIAFEDRKRGTPAPSVNARRYYCACCHHGFSVSSLRRLPYKIRGTVGTAGQVDKCDCGCTGRADDAAEHECDPTATAVVAHERAKREQQHAATDVMGSLWIASMRRIAELEAERDAAVARERAKREQQHADTDVMGSLWMASMRRIAELEAERDAAAQRAAAAVADRERERQAMEALEAELDASEAAVAAAACATQPHKVPPGPRPASVKGRRRRQRSA